MKRASKNPAYLGILLSSLLLAALLFGCGPDTQEAPSVNLGVAEDNAQTAGVIVPPTERQDSPEVAAAKDQLPHQYRERPPLNLLNFGFNLNPGNNR